VTLYCQVTKDVLGLQEVSGLLEYLVRTEWLVSQDLPDALEQREALGQQVQLEFWDHSELPAPLGSRVTRASRASRDQPDQQVIQDSPEIPVSKVQLVGQDLPEGPVIQDHQDLRDLLDPKALLAHKATRAAPV
jgi:hypothetical protein